VPRLIEGVLVGKRVVGVAAGGYHTVVWTKREGEKREVDIYRIFFSCLTFKI
jgi:hypothetical protein